MEQGKVCSKCGEWKILDGFYKDKKMKDGRQSKCKECAKKHSIQNYYANHEYYLKKQKHYSEDNKDKIREYKKQYNKKYTETNSKYYKQYRIINSDRLSKQKKKYYKDNSKYIKEYQKRYRKDNPDYVREYHKQYVENNRVSIRKYKEKYRHSEKGKESSYRGWIKRRSYEHDVKFTPHERKEILERDNWTCQCCGAKVHDRSNSGWNTPDKAHIDHIIPISKGGNSEPNNLQVLCRTCNLSKSNKMDDELLHKAK